VELDHVAADAIAVSHQVCTIIWQTLAGEPSRTPASATQERQLAW